MISTSTFCSFTLVFGIHPLSTAASYLDNLSQPHRSKLIDFIRRHPSESSPWNYIRRHRRNTTAVDYMRYDRSRLEEIQVADWFFFPNIPFHWVIMLFRSPIFYPLRITIHAACCTLVYGCAVLELLHSSHGHRRGGWERTR